MNLIKIGNTYLNLDALKIAEFFPAVAEEPSRGVPEGAFNAFFDKGSPGSPARIILRFGPGLEREFEGDALSQLLAVLEKKVSAAP